MEATLYLDWNATTPPAPEVLEAMTAVARDAWANPASVHAAGRRARALVEDAREAVAALCHAHPRDVVLTSGGTEANNLAVQAMASGDPRHDAWVLSRLEHPSVIRSIEAQQAAGAHVEWIELGESGRVTLEDVTRAVERAKAVAPVRLVCLQAVNHETGVVQPVREVCEWTRREGLASLVDAVQAAGKLEPEAWVGADLVTVASHKLRGPKGVGAVVTRPRLKLRPVLRGGEQERGIRPGTQDPVACAGFAIAAWRAVAGPARHAGLAPLRDELEAALVDLGRRRGTSVVANGTAPRLAHVSNLSWLGWSGPELCAALDLEGICVSSGSACSAGTADPSPVLFAMVGSARASSAVRISLGELTTPQVIHEVILKWSRVVTRGAENLSPAP